MDGKWFLILCMEWVLFVIIFAFELICIVAVAHLYWIGLGVCIATIFLLDRLVRAIYCRR